MAVAVKSSQSEEAELICGVSSDCVMLQPAKLEPEPLNFISVNNGVYATATSGLSELYNCQSVEPTYQQLTSYQPFPADIQVLIFIFPTFTLLQHILYAFILQNLIISLPTYLIFLIIN